MRIIPFWIRLLLTLNKAWIPSSLIPLRHQNWTLPWMSLMPLHLQSHLGFSVWLVLFLITAHCSLLLALDLVNCGARLGLFLHLCLWQPRCWHLNWFIIFLATMQLSDLSPLLHQITSPWNMPIGRLKYFNCYLHIPSFKMPTIRYVQQLIQRGDYAYLHIPIVQHCHHFLQFVWHNLPYQWKVLPLGWPQSLWFSQPLLNLFSSFAIASV